jgi:hypothetical protein
MITLKLNAIIALSNLEDLALEPYYPTYNLTAKSIHLNIKDLKKKKKNQTLLHLGHKKGRMAMLVAK